jgi:hypothetical protein
VASVSELVRIEYLGIFRVLTTLQVPIFKVNDSGTVGLSGKLLFVLSRAVILCSESRGTRDQLFFSHNTGSRANTV